MVHWHQVCGQKPTSCRVTVEFTQYGWINKAHVDREHRETCEQLLPRELQMLAQQIGKACADEKCDRYQKEQGILV